MFANLAPGAIGIRVDFEGAVRLAAQHGWQGIDLPVGELAGKRTPTEVQARVADAGLRLGGWGLGVDWRAGVDDALLRTVDAYAALAGRLGCTRAYTWLLPASDTLPFHANFERHVQLLQPIARVLEGHGCRLGLEFIGPRTMREQQRYGFIYSLEGMLCLARAIGDNVGLLLDCWHWYTSLGTTADIRGLRADDVVYVHVNDAPAGVPVEAQIDQVRRLPGATGVIDSAGFLGALREIGYDGPLTPEPFDRDLAALPPEQSSPQALAHVRRIMEGAGIG